MAVTCPVIPVNGHQFVAGGYTCIRRMDTSHAHAAIPTAPALIVNAINTFTALLSSRSTPLSTRRLS